MNLQGKTLLILGGGAYAQHIAEYKKEAGFRVVAVGDYPDSRCKDVTDVFCKGDRLDVNFITDVVKKEHVDGIFVGSSENYASVAIDVCERTNARFYSDRKQWDLISNKATFKDYARRFNVPVVPEYKLSDNPSDSEIGQLRFPVMIKPTDSSGAKGLNACYSIDEFRTLYNEALEWSEKKEVIVEELITDAVEVFVHYTIQDGISSLSAAFTKFKVNSQENYISLPIFHMYPSRYIDKYYDEVNENAKRMFEAMGLKNGLVMLQGFYKNGKFMFFESGYRLGGEQMYILTDYMWGVNSLKYMINYVLTGSMSDEIISIKDNARFPYPCCNYYMALKAGIIGKIEGYNEVKNMDGVLNITEIRKPGDTIVDTNALDRIIYRFHVVGRTSEDLAKRLVNISNTIRVISINGDEMQIEHLTYERCLNAIKDM